jgi:hypothetical protein
VLDKYFWGHVISKGIRLLQNLPTASRRARARAANFMVLVCGAKKREEVISHVITVGNKTLMY